MILDYLLIKQLEPKRMLFLDVSEHKNVPLSPTLYIKFPGFKKEYSVSIDYSSVNILNTSVLKFTTGNIEFEDGVYEFRYEINNGKCEVRRKEFITTQAYAKLNEALKNFDFTNKDLLDKFMKISLYLQGAESVVCTNSQQAEALYKQADNLLKCF